MSKIEEIEQALEQLPLTDFVKVAVWVDQRRQQLAISPSASDKNGPLDGIYAILGERYQSGEHDVAARHNEHQP